MKPVHTRGLQSAAARRPAGARGRSGRLRLALVLLGLAAIAAPLSAQERRLSWRELAVHARLDAEGRLHVVERHAMVFTGDWNGGERIFNTRFGQRLDIQRVSRIDPATGASVTLTEGDVDEVDHWKLESNRTLRWRSRRPGDPPFKDTVLTYVLEYTLSNVVWKEDGVYHLSHDFAFPDREWPIERFVLDLEIDPAWRVLGKVARHVEQTNLAPGESFVVGAALEHRGEGRVSSTRTVLPPWLRTLPFAGSLAVMAFLYWRFRRREAGLGRFAPLPVPERPDPAWLEKNLFRYRPEEVGALWDRKVGPPEVAATLARLVGEGKLASEVAPRRGLLGLRRGDLLRLRRIAPSAAFNGYEDRLVRKLFFGDRTEVDTEEIRKHYKKTGLDPAALIREDLERSLRNRPELRETKPAGSWKTTLWLALALAALVGLDAILEPEQALILSAGLVGAATVFAVPALVAAAAWRRRTERLHLASLGFLLPMLALVVVCWGAACLDAIFGTPGEYTPQPGPFALLAFALLPVVLFRSALRQAASRETPETIRRRRGLAGLRQWLRRELARPEPALRDEWFPYLLAFGLQGEVDRWFRSFGGMAQAGRGLSTGIGAGIGTSSSGPGGGGWTGGGGRFGGAGATSSWAAAASGLAGGVSSSSSHGGGGGGGGSSGGGGGGGW